MYIYHNQSLDCYFNLALEEYLLRQTTGDYIILWRSNSSVVIGKHQNLHAEVVEPESIDKQIAIARRLSGGGTVYHDLGNLNFTFIKTGEPEKLVDFKQFIEPVAAFLNELGVPAVLSERNDIMIEGLKVSGNAEHVFKNRVLHHGTLLFDSNLSVLSSVLRHDPSSYHGRGVASVRKPVTRIKDYLSEDISIESFIDKISIFLQKRFEANNFELSIPTSLVVKELATEKYATESWIYDYSPSFTLKKELDIGMVVIEVKKGMVMSISSNFLSEEIRKRLVSTRFSLSSFERCCTSAKDLRLVRSLFR